MAPPLLIQDPARPRVRRPLLPFMDMLPVGSGPLGTAVAILRRQRGQRMRPEGVT